MQDPLLFPAAAIAAGIIMARHVELGEGELAAAVAVLALLSALGLRWATKRIASAACLIAFACTGALVAVAHLPGSAPELDSKPREVVILSGCVVEPSVLFEDRAQFVLELAPGARARVSVYAREGEAPPRLHYGQVVELDSRVRRPHNFQNPGSFDYAGYLARQQIFWTASARPSDVRVQAGQCGSKFRSFVFGLREAALDRVESLYRGDRYKAGMMKAVLVGDSSSLETVWTEDFRRTGTYHALVISGLHISVLAGFFLFLWRVCGLPEKTGLVITTLAAFLYALVAGWQAPVVRPAVGFALYASTRYFFRRSRILNTLAAVAITFLVFDPEQLFEASFQLSFLSVFAIGALAAPALEGTTSPLSRGFSGLTDTGRDLHLPPQAAAFRVELRLLSEAASLITRVRPKWCLLALAIPFRIAFYVWEAVLVSGVVQASLVLPMAIYFHRLSLTGLSANVLIVPLMSAAVPAGFVAIFTNWVWAAALAGWLLEFSQGIAGWHVRGEPNWRIPNPPFWLALCVCTVLLGIAILIQPRADQNLSRWRRLALATLATVLTSLIGIVVWHPFAPRVVPGALELTAIDVGQGDSFLIGYPDGKLMLLDAGGFPAFKNRKKPRLDIGEDVVSPYLWSRSIRRLDAVALSHLHADHFGGLSAVIENFQPRELWVGITPNNPDWAALSEQACRNGVKVVALEPGRNFPFGGASVEVLSPAAMPEPPESADNNQSLVLRLTYGLRSALLTGDAEQQIEAGLLNAGVLSKTDVLKVAHHGGKTSTSSEFLAAVRPCFALISAGFENMYGVPHPHVLERLAGSRATFFRTDLDGLVTIRTDGRRLAAETAGWSGSYPALSGGF